VESRPSEQPAEITSGINSSLGRKHSQALSPSDYKLRTRIKRIVGIFLYFQHRRIRKLLRSVAEEFDRSGRIAMEVGAGSTSKHKYFSSALYVSSDLVMREGINLVEAASHLAFRDHSVDLVICENVIEHVYDPQSLLKETRRVLRRGGCLFLVTPFLFPLHDVPYDFFRYTEYSLKRLLHDYSAVSIHKVLWLPLPQRLFGRFVLYYACIARID
jgi:SAM-dependent methyltransferase